MSEYIFVTNLFEYSNIQIYIRHTLIQTVFQTQEWFIYLTQKMRNSGFLLLSLAVNCFGLNCISDTKMRKLAFLLLSLVLNCFGLNCISDTKMRNWGFLLLLSLALSCSASPPWLTKQYKGVAHPHRHSCPRHCQRRHHKHPNHHNQHCRHFHLHCQLHFDTRPNFNQKMGEVWACQV